jgi:hypothetical protein
MKFSIQVELDVDDINTLHDVIYNALGEKPKDDNEIFKIWGMLPDDMKLDAAKWGVNDTGFRDDMHEWLKEKHVETDNHSKDFTFTIKTKEGIIMVQEVATFGSEEKPLPEDWENDVWVQKAIMDHKKDMVDKYFDVVVEEGHNLNV